VPVSEQQPRQRDSRPRKALTIGAVCKILEGEFDDISISKIRYLEDQKLLSPRRTAGGRRAVAGFRNLSLMRRASFDVRSRRLTPGATLSVPC
jgi:hypothetical protein